MTFCRALPHNEAEYNDDIASEKTGPDGRRNLSFTADVARTVFLIFCAEFLVRASLCDLSMLWLCVIIFGEVSVFLGIYAFILNLPSCMSHS